LKIVGSPQFICVRIKFNAGSSSSEEGLSVAMEPGEALSTAAQIAVALAGFAGVVVVFRRESVHDWSPINKFRLRQLLTNLILQLAFCMIGLLLLTIRPVPADIWRWSRGAAFVILLLFGIGIVKVFRRFDLQELHRAGASRSVFYLTAAVGIAAILLQLYNAALLNPFCRFFTAIGVQLITAMFQFARMVLAP